MSKILHIFNDSPYTEKFIRFINKYFESTEHQFIILCINDKSKFLEFYKAQSNCDVTQSKSIYFKYSQDFKSAKQIIIHQLNKPQLMASLLVFYPQAYKKMVWSIWGGDVYFYKYKSNSFKDTLMEFLRKITISKIPVITSYIKGDYDEVVKIYNSSANYIKAKYPNPIDEETILKFAMKNKKNTDCISILVGNSADPSNEHIATFNLLQKFKDENIKVFSVLSYGGTKNYIDTVIQSGANIFGDKFEPILDYMNFEDYLSFLGNIDICVFNHKRQQGLGNVYILLVLQKKVFMDSSISPFRYYNELGITIYDTDKINESSLEDFAYQEQQNKINSYNLILNDISEKTIYQEWKKVFTENCKPSYKE